MACCQLLTDATVLLLFAAWFVLVTTDTHLFLGHDRNISTSSADICVSASARFLFVRAQRIVVPNIVMCCLALTRLTPLFLSSALDGRTETLTGHGEMLPQPHCNRRRCVASDRSSTAKLEHIISARKTAIHLACPNPIERLGVSAGSVHGTTRFML